MLFICRDGRIKVIGGDGIEGLLISPKQLPYKNIEVCIFASLKSLKLRTDICYSNATLYVFNSVTLNFSLSMVT